MADCCNQCCNPCCDNNGSWLGGGNTAWIIIAVIVFIWLFCGNGNTSGNYCC